MAGPFAPLSPRTHERTNRCALCGATTRLTDTHVPPKAAFNDRRSTRAIVDANQVVGNDHGRDGGIRVWGHCEACRRATSAWDDEYVTWAHVLRGLLLYSPAAGNRSSITGTSRHDMRPGRFARAALAGMTALAEDLVVTHPDLAAALRAGDDVVPLGDLRFLVAVTPKADRAYVGGGHQGLTATISLQTGQAPSAPTPSAVVHFPPLSLLLVGESTADQYPHIDHTGWLSEPADHARPLRLDLPAVELVAPFASGPASFRPTHV